MTTSELMALKGFGQTTITTGRYELILSFSDRFQKQLLLLLNVPGFEGIRIHSGNFPKDTEGYLLVGRTKLPQPDMVGSRRSRWPSACPSSPKRPKRGKFSSK